MNTIIFTDNFFGEEITKEEKASGYISFETLFNGLGGGILCNEISTLLGVEINGEYHEENQINGDYYDDIYSYIILPQSSAEYYKSWTDYPLFYIDFLDLYVLGITHCGTPWRSVNSDIEIGKEYPFINAI